MDDLHLSPSGELIDTSLLPDGNYGDFDVTDQGEVITVRPSRLFNADFSNTADLDLSKFGALTGDVLKAEGSSELSFAPGVIVNADVNAAAAIDATKLGELTGPATKANGSATFNLADAVLLPANLQLTPGSPAGTTVAMGLVFPFAAGGPATVALGSPAFSFRVLQVLMLVSTAVVGSTAILFGGAQQLSRTMSAATTGTRYNALNIRLFSSGQALTLQRSDAGIEGTLIIFGARGIN